MILTLALMIVCLMIPLLIIFLAMMMSKRSNNDRQKSSPFECGFDPLKTARIPFSTRFFLLAVIFLVFDIEIVLLLPLCLIMNNFMIMESTITSLIIILILMLGLFHEWNEGSLNWSE